MYRMIIMAVLMMCHAPAAVADQAALQNAMAATLVVRSADSEDRFLGSAFVFGAQDRAVTNAHVVGAVSEVVVVDHTGAEQVAQVIAVDELRDLALLALTRPMGAVLLPRDRAVAIGMTVYAIGAPLQAVNTLTQGIVSNDARQVEAQQPVRYVQHSAPVNPGSSGGPLVDAQGRVIGVNSRIADGSRYFVGIAYAVPVADILAFIAAPQPARIGPGIQVRALTRQIRDALGLTDTQGVLVDHVSAGRPAALAGVMAGDVLLSIDTHTIARPGDIAFALAAAGVSVRVRVYRDGETLMLDMNLTPIQALLEPVSPTEPLRKASYTLAQMGIIADASGAITQMAQDGAGFFAGISVGDRIIAVDGRAVTALQLGWASALEVTKPVLLLIRLPDGATRHYVLNPWATTLRLRPSSGANILDTDVVTFE